MELLVLVRKGLADKKSVAMWNLTNILVGKTKT